MTPPAAIDPVVRRRDILDTRPFLEGFHIPAILPIMVGDEG